MLDDRDAEISEDGLGLAPGPGSLSGTNLASPSSFTALKLQRKQRLESLIEKRKNNFLYLMEIHSGGSYWLNSVLIDKKELHSYLVEKPSTRAVMYYYFGISLSKILELSSGPATIKAMIQLMEEWEYFFASTTMQSMKYMMARTSNYIYPNFMPTDTTSPAGSQGNNAGNNPNSNPDGDHQIKSGIYKFNNDVVYEYLLTPHIPFELNYIEVLYSLCQMLYDLYDKFWHEDSFSIITYYDAIVKLDARLKHFIINFIAKEFTDRSCHNVEHEIDLLRASLHNM